MSCVDRALQLEKQQERVFSWTSERLKLLDGLLDQVYRVLQPTKEQCDARRLVIQFVDNFVRQKIPGSSISVFGSFVMDLFTASSDLDLSLNVGDMPVDRSRGDKISYLRKLTRALQGLQKGKNGAQRNTVRKVEPVMRAAVPVVKFVEGSTNIECDVSMENRDGILKSELLGIFSLIDPRFRQLCFLVLVQWGCNIVTWMADVLQLKAWAKAHQINDSKKGTLNSLSIILLVAFHLQTRTPPILPPFSVFLEGLLLQATANCISAVSQRVTSYKERGFGRENNESITQLFGSFFLKLKAVECLWEQGLCASSYEGKWISKNGQKIISAACPDMGEDILDDLKGLPTLRTRLKFKLRAGSLPLNSKQKQRGKGECNCPLCGQSEDSIHFLIHCPGFSHQRDALFKSIKGIVPVPLFTNFESLEAEPKAQALLRPSFWANHTQQIDACVKGFLEDIRKPRLILYMKVEDFADRSQNCARSVREREFDIIHDCFRETVLQLQRPVTTASQVAELQATLFSWKSFKRPSEEPLLQPVEKQAKLSNGWGSPRNGTVSQPPSWDYMPSMSMARVTHGSAQHNRLGYTSFDQGLGFGVSSGDAPYFGNWDTSFAAYRDNYQGASTGLGPAVRVGPVGRQGVQGGHGLIHGVQRVSLLGPPPVDDRSPTPYLPHSDETQPYQASTRWDAPGFVVRSNGYPPYYPPPSQFYASPPLSYRPDVVDAVSTLQWQRSNGRFDQTQAGRHGQFPPRFDRR